MLKNIFVTIDTTVIYINIINPYTTIDLIGSYTLNYIYSHIIISISTDWSA